MHSPAAPVGVDGVRDAASAALAALARRADPADPGAQNNLGVVLLARGRRADAAEAFARALALDPHMTLARSNLDAAGGAEWRKRRARELRARLRLSDGDVDARRELATLLTGAGEFDGARRELDALRALRPRDAGVCVQRALCEQEAGDLDAALACLDDAIALDPDAALPRAHLGELLYRRGEPARALEALDAAVERAPEHADIHLARAFVLGELGRADDAAAASRRARTLNPALGRADANLAAPPAEGTSRPAAAPTRDSNDTRDERRPPEPRPADAHLALGLAFREKGYLDEAEREYRRALARSDAESVSVRALGEIHLLRGDPEAALVHWSRLTLVAPEDAAAWHGRAVAEHLAGRLDDAEESYRRATRCAESATPSRTAVLNDLGVLLAARGALASAAEVFLAATEGDDGRDRGADHRARSTARVNAAHVLSSLGRGEEALASLRAALRARPSDVSAWVAMGSVLAAAGRRAEARTALARALDEDPDRADARYALAFLAADAGDHDAARRDTERALTRAPHVSTRALTLAIDLGPGADLVPDRRVVTLDTSNAAERIAGFALHDGAVDGLLDELLAPEAASVVTSPADRPYAVAEECLRAGFLDRAAAAASSALARGASRTSGLTILGDVFAAQGFHGEALERYEAAAAAETSAAAAIAARRGVVRMLRETGRRRAARLAADALVELGERASESLALCALARIDDDASEAAIEPLEAATAQASSVRDWSLVAAAWRALGDRGRECDALGAALAIDPCDVTARLTHGRALVASGRDVEAAGEFDRLVAEGAGRVEARLELAALRAAAGDVAGARLQLVHVLGDDPFHLDALASLAALLGDQRRDADARVAVARVLRFDPAHPLALAVDGELLARAGRMPEARARWHGVLRADPVGEGAERARQAIAKEAA